MTVFAHDTLIANLYTLMYAYFYNISTIDSAVLPLQFSTQCIRWPFFLCYNLRYRKLLEFAENRLHIFLNIIKKASFINTVSSGTNHYEQYIASIAIIADNERYCSIKCNTYSRSVV